MGCGAASCSNGCMASTGRCSPRGCGNCENQGCDGSGRSSLLSKGKGERRSNRRSQTMGAPPAALMHQPVLTDDCVQHANGLGEEIQRLQHQLAEIKHRRAALIASSNCTMEMATANKHELVRCQEKLDAFVQEKDREMKRLEEEASRGRHVRMRVPHAGQFAGYRTRASRSPTRAHSPSRLASPVNVEHEQGHRNKPTRARSPSPTRQRYSPTGLHTPTRLASPVNNADSDEKGRQSETGCPNETGSPPPYSAICR